MGYAAKRPYGERMRPEDLIEDVEWMVETCECLTGAARRLGRNPESLATTLRRLGRGDLALALAKSEGEWNAKCYMRSAS